MGFARKLIDQVRIKKGEKAAFSGPKDYHFKMDLRVKAKGASEQIKVWFPLPKETSYQKTTGLKFIHRKPKIFEDDTFGNKVSYWEIKEPQDQKNYRFTLEAKIRVFPRTSIRVEGLLDNYTKDSPEYKIHTKSDPYFNFTNPKVKNLARKLKSNKKDVAVIARAFYDYVRDHLAYGDPTEDLYSSLDALRLNRVDCGGFDCLLGALLRYEGIPTRLLSGFTVDSKKSYMHAWLEFMTPKGEWIPLDPSMEHLRLEGRVHRAGGFGKVGNDRILTSVGSNIAVNGEIFPIIQMPIVEIKPKGSAKTIQSIVIGEIG